MKCPICNADKAPRGDSYTIRGMLAHARRSHGLSSEETWIAANGIHPGCYVCGVKTKYRDYTQGYSARCKGCTMYGNLDRANAARRGERVEALLDPATLPEIYRIWPVTTEYDPRVAG